MNSAKLTISIKKCIHFIRGNHIILDSDLARFYEVETKYLNRAVKRNIELFPADFMFELTQVEYELLQVDAKLGKGEHRKYLPSAFTGEGISMLSGILRSNRAVEIKIAIMRALVDSRNPSENPEIKHRLDRLDANFDSLEKKFEDFKQNFSKEYEQSKDSRQPLIPTIPNQSPSFRNKSSSLNSLKIERIQDLVAHYYGLKTHDLKARTRKKGIAAPRQIAMYLSRNLTQAGFREIAEYFGGKDHTTIIHGCQKIEEELLKNPELVHTLEILKNLIKSKN